MSDLSQLLQTCREHDIIIATAESCTGGMISTALTAIAGASDVFDRGFVTYSNDAKHDMLGVPKSLIKQHGAVSEQVAKAMVKGALEKSNANLAVSATGIAGPHGATAEKPVGLVYIGFCVLGEEVEAYPFQFNGTRTQIREQTTQTAIKLIADYLA